jgi:hypothetical protein
MLPIGVGYLRPISLSVLSDVLIFHERHSSIAFKARLGPDARVGIARWPSPQARLSDHMVTRAKGKQEDSRVLEGT